MRTPTPRIDLHDGTALALERVEPDASEGGWHLVAPDGTKRVSVTVAAMVARELADAVLSATETELRRCDASGTWRASVAERHPNGDPRVQRLYSEWAQAWIALGELHDRFEVEEVDAGAFPTLLESRRDFGPTSLRVLVTGHSRVPHHRTIATVLRELVAVWDCDSGAIVAGAGSGYVQVLVHPGKRGVYGEAADLDAQGI